MEQSCRVCLLADQTTTFHLTDIREDETFADILSFISGIEIRLTELLPQKLCIDCMKQVTSASEIKRKVIETEALLQSQFKEELQIKIELVDDPMPELHSIFSPEQFSIQKAFDGTATNNEAFMFNENIRKALKKPKKLVKRTNVCDSRVDSKSERKNKVPNELDYKCFICDLVFDKIWTKNKHVKTEHEAERICKICKAKCKTPLSLETHVKFHFRDYAFMCEICSKTFRYRNRLNSHMALHHANPTEMLCDLCGLSTKFKNNIKRHMKSVHMKLREFRCDQCSGHQYSTQEALNSHLYRYHNVPAPIKCPDCQHGFTFDSELRAHKKHGFCSNSVNAPFLRRGKTYEHLAISEETGEHVCKLCNEAFPSKNKWSMHNYLKHKYSNKCDECNIVFTNYTSLIRHEKVKHQGHKPFKCEFCFKCFGQKVSLISHRNTHTGEKTFGCAYCQFRSGDHGTVSKHKKKMHPEMMMSTSKASDVFSG